jgi:peptidoglycan/LPS O-acetylase OafA/YrhL
LFYWLDILRTIAAVGVLIWHYQHFYFLQAGQNSLAAIYTQPFYNYLILFYHKGFVFVQLFWVISGFIFCARYLNNNYVVSAKEFFINRFARLYPLHFITLLTVALLQYISNEWFQIYQIYPYNDFRHFILNLFLVSHWGFQKGWSFNAPIWSVSVEIPIYIYLFYFLYQ